MDEVKKIAKKLKRIRTVATVLLGVVVFILSLLTIAAGAGGSDINDALNVYITFIAVAIIIYFFVFAFLGLSIDQILLRDCDPIKYYGVFTEFYKGKRISKITSVQVSMMTSTFSGDFRAAMETSEKLMVNKRAMVRLVGYSHYLNAAYYLGEAALFDEALEDFKTLADDSKSKRYKTLYASILNNCLRRQALREGDVEKALRYLEADQLKSVHNIEKTQSEYAKGVTYFAAGEKEKAIQCLMNAKDICGKTYIGKFADAYLEQLK